MQVFGVTTDGTQVEKLTLRAGDLTVSVLTWGAVLQSVRLDGVTHDLTLGSDTLSDYEGNLRYHGSVIAPVVNRLTGSQHGDQAHRYTVDAADNRLFAFPLTNGADGTDLCGASKRQYSC